MEVQTQRSTIATRILLISLLLVMTISLFIMPALALSYTPDFSPILALILSVVPIMIILGILGLILGYLRGRK